MKGSENMQDIEGIFDYIRNTHHQGTDLMSALIRLKEANIRRKYGNLSMREFLTLEILYANLTMNDNKLNISPSDLANKMKLSMPQVSRIMNSLEEKGYIERILGKKDRRNTYIVITEKGIEEREISVKECKAYVDRIKEQMGEEDMNQLIELLNKLTNVMKGEQ